MIFVSFSDKTEDLSHANILIWALFLGWIQTLQMSYWQRLLEYLHHSL